METLLCLASIVVLETMEAIVVSVVNGVVITIVERVGKR